MEKKGVDGFLDSKEAKVSKLLLFSYLEEQDLKKIVSYPLSKRGGDLVLK